MSATAQPISSSDTATEPTGSLQVSQVPPDLATSVWERFLPLIERALSRGAGCTTPTHMLAEILTGDMQLWAVHEGEDVIAAVVVSVRKTSVKTSVCVELVAGRDLDRWIGKLEDLWREFRDLAGADTIQASCRGGIARRLKRRGWRVRAQLMELQ